MRVREVERARRMRSLVDVDVEVEVFVGASCVGSDSWDEVELRRRGC